MASQVEIYYHVAYRRHYQHTKNFTEQQYNDALTFIKKKASKGFKIVKFKKCLRYEHEMYTKDLMHIINSLFLGCNLWMQIKKQYWKDY